MRSFAAHEAVETPTQAVSFRGKARAKTDRQTGGLRTRAARAAPDPCNLNSQDNNFLTILKQRC